MDARNVIQPMGPVGSGKSKALRPTLSVGPALLEGMMKGFILSLVLFSPFVYAQDSAGRKALHSVGLFLGGMSQNHQDPEILLRQQAEQLQELKKQQQELLDQQKQMIEEQQQAEYRRRQDEQSREMNEQLREATRRADETHKKMQEEAEKNMQLWKNLGVK